MKSILRTWFMDHPETVGETYLEHFRFAGSFAWTLFTAALAALIHAFIPALFEKTAGEKIRQLARKIDGR